MEYMLMLSAIMLLGVMIETSSKIIGEGPLKEKTKADAFCIIIDLNFFYTRERGNRFTSFFTFSTQSSIINTYRWNSHE